MKIAEAQLNLDDAMDEAVLERTLYGHIEETDEQQADGYAGCGATKGRPATGKGY